MVYDTAPALVNGTMILLSIEASKIHSSYGRVPEQAASPRGPGT